MKKSPTKTSTKGPVVAPSSFQLTFSPPTDGLQHLESLIYGHPGDLTSLDILPGDTVMLLSMSTTSTPIPLYCGRIWPLRKCPPGALRLTCISTLLEGLSPGCTLEDATLGVSLRKVGAAGPGGETHPPIPVAQHVRIIRRVGEAVGAPSMATLQRGMLGVVLPMSGLDILLPNVTTSEPSSTTVDSAATSTPLFRIKVSPQPHQGSTPPCVLVTGDTVFTEGAPSRRPPTTFSTTTTTTTTSNTSPINDAQQQQQHHMDGKGYTPPPPLGGLDTQFSALLTMARNALERTSLSTSSSSFSLPPQGALLSGPPGTGKTHLVRCVCSALGVVPVVVTGGEIMSDVVGEAEGRLREAWERARRSGGVLFLDEVDTLCPSRDLSGVGEVEARLVAQLTRLMDGSGTSPRRGRVGGVFVIGATNRPGVLDPSLRRPGRFDVEMNVGVPTASAREEILWACLQRYGSSCVVTREEAGRVSQGKMHGFVGADIAGACREASWVSIRRALHSNGGSGGGGGVEMDLSSRFQAALTLGDASTSPPLPPPPTPMATSVTLTLEDLIAGIARVQPSALREVAVEVAQTPWNAIAGQEEVKARLREAIEWPIKYAHLFTALGISPPRGILLYGPPGCSKTMMARALATSGSMNFISIKGPELLSKYVGDSEKAVARVFSLARGAAPCLLFFDEFDSLGVRRDSGGEDGGGGSGVGVRVVAQLLQEMDGLRGGGTTGNGGRVLLVAATNRPDLLDPALLRPGRMDQLLYVGLPDAPARAAIALSHFTALARNGACVTVTPEEVAAMTEGMSGAEVTGVLRDAGSRALQEAMEAMERGATTSTSTLTIPTAPSPPTLALCHVESAASAVPRQITPAMLQFYADWAAK